MNKGVCLKIEAFISIILVSCILMACKPEQVPASDDTQHYDWVYDISSYTIDFISYDNKEYKMSVNHDGNNIKVSLKDYNISVKREERGTEAYLEELEDETYILHVDKSLVILLK